MTHEWKTHTHTTSQIMRGLEVWWMALAVNFYFSFGMFVFIHIHGCVQCSHSSIFRFFCVLECAPSLDGFKPIDFGWRKRLLCMSKSYYLSYEKWISMKHLMFSCVSGDRECVRSHFIRATIPNYSWPFDLSSLFDSWCVERFHVHHLHCKKTNQNEKNERNVLWPPMRNDTRILSTATVPI